MRNAATAMLGRKKKQVIMSIETDGRVREFNSLEDAAELYQITVEDIRRALETKERFKLIWFRNKADKIVSKVARPV